MVRFAAVEGGGTTWVAAISENTPDNVVDRCSFPTKNDPKETLGEVKAWLSSRQFDSIGKCVLFDFYALLKILIFYSRTSRNRHFWACGL